MRLNAEQIAQFHKDGFLIVKNVFDADDFNPVKAAITKKLDETCEALLREGLITDAHYDAPFTKRFGLLIAQADEIQGGLDIDQSLLDEFFELLSHEKILNVIRSILGDEISINPIHHLRAKPPAKHKDVGFYSVPWHQDAGVLTENTDDQLIITAWYPLGNATEEMGCMRLIPGCKPGNLLPHISSDYGTAIHPDYMPKAEPILAECEEGDVIFMTQWCPHHSTQNESDICRWSMDTRYHVTGTPSGRDWYPATPVRSAGAFETVSDPAAWRQAWTDAKSKENPGVVHRVVDKASV